MKYFYNKIQILHLILFAIIAVCLAGPAIAEEDPPIHVEADRMTSTEKDNSVVFTGEVDAKQGDVRIRSDIMTVYYTPKEESDSEQKVTTTTQKVEKLICTGNVEITRAEWLGTSKKMVYLAKERQVILTGNAKAWEGQNMVSGEKIIYHIDEGRSEVIGSSTLSKTASGDDKEKPKRVNMTILQN